MTIIDFLRDRLDEDEAAARASHYEGQRWISEEETVSRYPADEVVHYADTKTDARHIARHDPARVLRDVEAKRKILARYLAWQQALRGGPGSPAPSAAVVAVATALTDVVADLAAAYRDHPDYRDDLI